MPPRGQPLPSAISWIAVGFVGGLWKDLGKVFSILFSVDVVFFFSKDPKLRILEGVKFRVFYSGYSYIVENTNTVETVYKD